MEENTKLPVEAKQKIWFEAEKYTEGKVKAINEEHFNVYNAYIEGATAYAHWKLKYDELCERYKSLDQAMFAMQQEHLKAQTGPVWVKASERLPGWKKRVKWRDGNNHSYATDGEISLFEMEKPNLEGWEWLDESAGESDAVELIKYIRENYKPSKEAWKDKFGIALLSDEGILSMYKQQKEK